VDDDAALRSRLAASLRSDFDIVEGKSYEDAFQLLQDAELDILLLDIEMPPAGLKDCLDLLKQLSESEIDALVITMSEESKKSLALKVLDSGAYDCFFKPVSTDVLRPYLHRSIDKLLLERENRLLRGEIQRKNAFGKMIGRTEVMQQLFHAIERVAKGAATVIVRGESGTGKELVARAIHHFSPRKNKPFVGVNCAALPETLIEAELFGYDKGAFTGATEAKEGQIELAQHGTLFLDEIATLAPPLQNKLLRVLEERELVRLGGKKPIKVDFRLVTATNDDLEQMVHDGTFREELYYRIHVVPLVLPALRERAADIPLLADYFLRAYCATNQVPLKRISREALETLKHYHWPGNVRELENVIQRLILMTDQDEITIQDLPLEIQPATGQNGRAQLRIPTSGFRLDDELEEHERRCLESALAQARRVKAEAAKILGVNRNRLDYLCRKHHLS
jgi:DNA-binding NtrC family response regulator